MTTKKSAPRKAATKKTPRPKTAKKASEDVMMKGALAKTRQPLTLVTGGTGFLGSHLVRQLVAAGERNLRVLSTSKPAWLAELGVETVSGSITNADDVARAVEGVTEIYHLAGRVSRSNDDAHEMYALHVEGTRLLCEAARAAGAKTIVLASSSGTIAVTAEGDIVPDEDWTPPLDIVSRWPYYASKVYQERVALEHFAGGGLRLVIMNPSLLLGPGDERLSSTKLVLDFLARKIISVPHGGLSFVDVRDAAEAFRAAMARRQTRRTIPARRGQLDVRQVSRTPRTIDQDARAAHLASFTRRRLRRATFQHALSPLELDAARRTQRD